MNDNTNQTKEKNAGKIIQILKVVLMLVFGLLLFSGIFFNGLIVEWLNR